MATPVPVPVGLEAIKEALERIRFRLNALEEALSDLIDWIDCSLTPRSEPEPPVAPGAGTPAMGPRKRKQPWFRDPTFVKMAEPGVAKLTILPLHGHGHLVSVNDGDAVPVSDEEAEILRLLTDTGVAAGPPSPSPDGFPPWKDKIDVELACGRARHTINVRVLRLRHRLWHQLKVSPMLVETRSGQIRFRLRVSTATEPVAPAAADRTMAVGDAQHV